MRFVLVIFLFLVSCSSVRVNYDYDKKADFSNYTSYNYFQEMETGLSQLDEKRLFKVLDSTLEAKGFLLSKSPDFLINILSEEYRDATQSNVGVGIGGTGRNVGGGISIGIPVRRAGLERTIQFDFVNAQKNELFWQATADSGFKSNASPLAREKELKKVVDKVFSKFPPQFK